MSGLVSETTRTASMAIGIYVRIAAPVPICALSFLKDFSHGSRGNETRTAILKLFFFSISFPVYKKYILFFCCFVFCPCTDVTGLTCKCRQTADQAQGQVDTHMRGCA